MKILYTSDIHASATHLSSMLSVAEKEEVSCIIIGGDIVPHNLSNSAGAGPVKAQAIYLENVFIPAIREFRQERDVAIYLDLGNDDFSCNRTILEKCDPELLNLIHLKKTKLTDDVDIIGYMIVPPTPFTRKDMEKPDSSRQPYAPGNTIVLKGYKSKINTLEETVIDLSSGDTIEKDLDGLSESIDRPFIFVSHSPPYDTSLDVLYNGMHAGSVSIRAFIEKWSQKGRLIASFHGHIHESPARSGSISTEIDGTLCINPGQGDGRGAGFRYVIFRLAGPRALRNADILKVGR
ncbi:MAG: metallophosphoesterase [Deltaproteobacteria bacterium]|nr:metallophosphoesterase [Deltaproteobacteria bacterium]